MGAPGSHAKPHIQKGAVLSLMLVAIGSEFLIMFNKGLMFSFCVGQITYLVLSKRNIS